MNKKSLAGPRALTIIGSLAMLVSLVLPYATSSNDTMTALTIAERIRDDGADSTSAAPRNAKTTITDQSSIWNNY